MTIKEAQAPPDTTSEADPGGEREEEIAGLPAPLGDVIKVLNSMTPGDRLNLVVVAPNQDAREVAVHFGIRPNER